MTIETILKSGITDQNAHKAKRIVRDQFAALSASEFRLFAESHRLPIMTGKKNTLQAIERFIDNQSVLYVQTR